MPEFTYIARDLSGQRLTGKIECATQAEAVAALGQKALFPISVKAAANTGFRRGRRVKGQLVSTTYGQLADLLRSGVPLLRSIAVIRDQATHAGLKQVMTDLHEQVSQGRTLSEAMARHPRVFSEMGVSVVRAGSEGGFLEEALDRIADFTEQQQDLKGRVLGAITYPLFLMSVGMIVVTVLLVYVVPKFAPLFDRMRSQGGLPRITDWLLGFSKFLSTWWWALAIVLGVIGAFIYMRISTPEGRMWVDRAKLHMPVAGRIFLNFSVARFCRVLGTLLKNGVPILRSLEISSDAAGNRILTTAINKASENITAGESLATPLRTCHQFPPAVVEMIAVAEEANSLDTVLVEIADGLDRRTWRQLDLLVRLLEPVMLLLIAVIVLMLAIALLVPVLQMSTTIK
jgi:general secretion pathway protein F/type IV pilus assembly protein PilC